MLVEGAGTTIQQEGYGAAFHAEETMSEEESLTETIVKYVERVSLAESRVSELEGRLSILEMGSTVAQAPPGYAPQPPPHTAYFAPAAPTFQAQQPTKQSPSNHLHRKHSGCQPINSSGYHSDHVRVEEAALRTRVKGVKRKSKLQSKWPAVAETFRSQPQRGL